MPLNPVLPPPRRQQSRNARDLLRYGWEKGKATADGRFRWKGTDEHKGQYRTQKTEPGTGRAKKAAPAEGEQGDEKTPAKKPAAKKPAAPKKPKVDHEEIGKRIQGMLDSGDFTDQDVEQLKGELLKLNKNQLAALRAQFPDLGVKAGRSNAQGAENLAGGVAGKRKAKEPAPTPEPSPEDAVNEPATDYSTLKMRAHELAEAAVVERFGETSSPRASGLYKHLYIQHLGELRKQVHDAGGNIADQPSGSAPTPAPKPTKKPPIAIGEEDVAGIVGPAKKPGKGTSKPVDDREARIQAHRERVAREAGNVPDDDEDDEPAVAAPVPPPQKPGRRAAAPKQPKQPRKKPAPPPMPEPEDDGPMVIGDEPAPGGGPQKPPLSVPPEPSPTGSQRGSGSIDDVVRNVKKLVPFLPPQSGRSSDIGTTLATLGGVDSGIFDGPGMRNDLQKFGISHNEFFRQLDKVRQGIDENGGKVTDDDRRSVQMQVDKVKKSLVPGLRKMAAAGYRGGYDGEVDLNAAADFYERSFEVVAQATLGGSTSTESRATPQSAPQQSPGAGPQTPPLSVPAEPSQEQRPPEKAAQQGPEQFQPPLRTFGSKTRKEREDDHRLVRKIEAEGLPDGVRTLRMGNVERKVEIKGGKATILNARSPVGILLNARNTAQARPLLYAWTRKRSRRGKTVWVNEHGDRRYQDNQPGQRPNPNTPSNSVPVEEALRRVLEAPYQVAEQHLTDLRNRLLRLKPVALAMLNQMFPVE